MNEKILYQGELSLCLPDGFFEAEKENNLNSTFDYVFRDSGHEKGIAFVKNEQTITKADIANLLPQSKAMLSEITPGFQHGEAKIKETERFNVGLLTYQSKVDDKDLFNVFSIMNLNEKGLIMTFFCDMRDADSFLPQVLETIDGISVTA